MRKESPIKEFLITEIIDKYDINYHDLAKNIGVTRAYISSICTGVKPMSNKIRDKIIETYDFDKDTVKRFKEAIKMSKPSFKLSNDKLMYIEGRIEEWSKTEQISAEVKDSLLKFFDSVRRGDE